MMSGLYHNFWLFREGERSYTNYRDLLPRRDPPACLHDDFLIGYLWNTLSWIPTLNPRENMASIATQGLNRWGPTIINHTGGAAFQRLCNTWAQLFSQGPEQLKLTGPLVISWPFEEDEHMMERGQLMKLSRRFAQLTFQRDELVLTFTTLAQFGAQAATGEFFIFHFGV
jgi:hypothetical protein